MGYWIIDGKQMTDAEYEEYKRQEELAKERVRQEAAMLMNQLAQTYEALTRLLQQNADVGREVTGRTERKKRFTGSCGIACSGRTRPRAAGG
jgi:hypothetical protein